MIEEVLATARYNAKVDPFLQIWTWEVAVYLFLGGVTAGIMFFSAASQLLRKDRELPFTANQLPLWAPVVLSIGMTTLFLDLEHKLYVFRFYTTLQPSSPMSWGSWILILVYPISILQITATFRKGYPGLMPLLKKIPLLDTIAGKIFDFSEQKIKLIAMIAIPVSIALGIYTGILLSTFSARPFWNTTILGPLFLVSGLSAAAAIIIIGARNAAEKHLFAKVDMIIIGVELLLVGLLLIGLTTGSKPQIEALELIMGGPFAWAFWGLFVTGGLVLPLMLELWQKRARSFILLLAPLLVLFGGYMLRHVTLELGQASHWNKYEIQFEPKLLDRLHDS